MKGPQCIIGASGLSTPARHLDEIRLVRIFPGAEDEAISGLMENFSMCSCPSYTALSYFCGDPSITETIHINGTRQEVTTNLASFLRHYRILFGGSTPMVLRPVDDHFLQVGECYVHGIMDGEALSGVDLRKEARIFEVW